MEKYLKDTYGVTVYQEQVMLLSQLLANFTKGEADTLRKAMGKKIFAMLAMLKPKFIERGSKNGHDPKILEKIWADWEKFASYAFNKSHAACYGWVAYQTGYLKAHYPAEYMAANLTQSKDSISDVTKFMDECKAMGLKVKGPNVNESDVNFTVNKQGEILFGMGGVKGVGEGPVLAILKAREEGGPFKSIFDFVERVNLQTCNRKAIESLALAGAFDTLGDMKREQFFAPVNSKGMTGSEVLVQYGNSYQNDKNKVSNSLFGDMMEAVEIAKPELPKIVSPWSDLERLNKEKDVVGIYLTSHPLDMYKFEMKYVMNTKISDLAEDKLPEMVGRNFITGGIVTGVRDGYTKKGDPYRVATIEDMEGSGEIALFSKDYAAYSNFFTVNAYVCVSGTISKSQWNDRIIKNYNKVMFMSELREGQKFRSATINVDFKMVDGDTIEQLKSVMIENHDKHAAVGGEQNKTLVPVTFILHDNENNREVRMSSRTYSVELGPGLMNLMERNPEMKLTLVS